MKLLRTERGWKRWAKGRTIGTGAEFEPPVTYPCFGYTVVADWGNEEVAPVYLYLEDLLRMSAQAASDDDNKMAILILRDRVLGISS